MKMRGAAAAALFLIMLTASGSGTAAGLVKKWDSGKVFSTPESVVYDDERHVLYVSNISGSPGEKDGDGFISRISMKGELEKLKWVTGLDAPKGMGISGRRLYVADIDRLVEIDIARGAVLAEYPAPGAEFLNDVAVDGSGAVYVSDSARGRNAIYRFSEGKLELWIRNRKLSGANGLCVRGNTLVVGVSGDAMLRGVSLSDQSIDDVAVIGSPIDGLAYDGEGNFFVSDWRGKTVIVDGEGGISVLLDTSAEGINSADIAYLPKWKMLIIPTFSDNRVIACTVVF